MSLSLFLAKVWGTYIILKGVIVVMNRKEVVEMSKQFAESTSLRWITSLLVSILGLLIVYSHNVWVGWPVIITILGYLLVVESVIFMIISKETARDFIDYFTKNSVFYVSATVSILLGIYLLSKGFGWL